METDPNKSTQSSCGMTSAKYLRIADPPPEVQEAVRRIIFRFGFTAKEHIAVAEKLLCIPPKARFENVVQPLPRGQNPQDYLRALPRLIKRARYMDMIEDQHYASIIDAVETTKVAKLRQILDQMDFNLQAHLRKFHFQWRFFLDTALIAFQVQNHVKESQAKVGSSSSSLQKLTAIESFIRMPTAEYISICENLRAAIPNDWQLA